MNKSDKLYKTQYQREYMKKNKDKIQPRRKLKAKKFFYALHTNADGNQVDVKAHKKDFASNLRRKTKRITREQYFAMIKDGKTSMPSELQPINVK
jgi:hypothetical protein